MNTAKQFWALFKFQAMINPFIFFSVFMFLGMPFWIPLMSSSRHDYHPSLSMLLMNTNLFFVGFIGAMVIAPEVFQYGASPQWSSGTEFVLTRAVDRRIYFRARSSFYYALVLVIPVLLLLGAFFRPELRIDEYHPATHREILAQLPGSIAAPTDKRGVSTGITLPEGNVLVAGWHLAIFILAAVATQGLISLIYPLKYRRWIFWSCYLILVFGPIFFLGGNTSTSDPPTREEIAFLYFSTHQLLAWAVVLAAAVLIQLGCERRMSQVEM